MDLKMPKMNGVQATRAIREQFPNVRVLVLTAYDADEWVIDAIRSGASGYLLKDTPQEDLIEAIVDTVKGSSHIDPLDARLRKQGIEMIAPHKINRRWLVPRTADLCGVIGNAGRLSACSLGCKTFAGFRFVMIEFLKITSALDC